MTAAPVIDQKRKASGVTPTSPAYFAKLVEIPIRAPPTNRQIKGMSHVFLLRNGGGLEESFINYPIG
jgi:hypothetical protein